MVSAFCWKLGHAYCGFGEEEDTKPGLISGPDEYEEDEISKEAKEHQDYSIKIIQLEDTIQERVRRRQERSDRLTVYARQFDATQCPTSYPKTDKELAFLRRVLAEDRHFIFCDFTERERELMLEVFRKDDTVEKGQILYCYGDPGDGNFYVIEKGSVDIMEGHSTGKITTKTIGHGDQFGEVALLFDAPRMTTARARTDCVLWKMHQRSFRAKLANYAMKKEEEMIELLRTVPLFKELDEFALRKFAQAMERVLFRPDQRILNKGDIGNIFYIIEQGQVRIHAIGDGDSQSVDQVKEAGQYIGERALLTGEPRYAHATAITKVIAWAVERETFETSFGPLQDVIRHQMKKGFLVAIPIFAQSEISNHEMDILAEKMKELSFLAGYQFDEVGKPRQQDLIIIQRGRVAVYDGDAKEDGSKVFTLKNGDYYGDKHIKEETAKESSLNVVCEENTTVWSLSREDLKSTIGDMSRLGSSLEFRVKRRVSAYSKHIPLKELERVKILGHGGFGRVWLAKHNRTGIFYALKELNKRRILDKKQAKNLLREKEILATLKHPFILGEVTSYQDEVNCYILTNLVQGGELYTLIVNTKGKGLPFEHAQFYGACIHSALAYFHKRMICYRDLKPENVMIGKDGYCVIVDLGFAKVVTTKTFTLCGTPEYLAPEVLMSHGYDKAADLWSFGVLMYEMLIGKSAFYRYDRKQIEMFKYIVRTDYELPPELDGKSEDLIKRLLVRNPALRLGNTSNGSDDIRGHAFFEGIDWTKLRKMEVEAPWVPTIKEGEAVTSSHFSSSEGAYREIAFGRPLTEEEQKMFKSF